MHHSYMNLALTLAEQGRYSVSPNPMVGCVIVNHGEIVGQGYHHHVGGPHAEIQALSQAKEQAKDATVYVTLEPCCHLGKTPPCTKALIQAGVKRVIIACYDPNPLVAGKGLAELNHAGIQTEIGLLQKKAQALNEIFFYFMQHKKPFVFAKWAMSLDGKTITQDNDDSCISSVSSHEHSHQLRQQVDAILVGATTAQRDNPLLTARYALGNVNKQPTRIILTSGSHLPLDLNLFNANSSKTWVFTTSKANRNWIDALEKKSVSVYVLPANEKGLIDISVLLMKLAELGMSSLLVEGGMTVLQHFFNANLVNKIHVYLAPVIIGSLKTKQLLTNVSTSHIENDFFISGDFLSCLAES